ncbi:sigma-54 interaction domain-containing protein [Laribacter hongkongensis]|uniref:sigma-54 interaction domain-containing protein n=1 Tax=Laribacter hongkongensis TaxID=168471 RepID=UPI001EFCDF43|nr:sigma 54-interacting transcriptional regulator [Laribacter hongkongensis]MCG9084385.1 sigma 54-interacting transcriptional regulator [Laribacter hongkongensis]
MKEIDWFARNLGEALNTLDQAITIVDKAGRFVYYNRASARMDGQDADKILGRHVLEINPWLTEEDSTLLRCIRDGVRFVDSYQAYSGTGGEKLHYLHSAIPLYGQKGDLIGAIEIGKMLTAAPAHLGHHAAPPDIVGEHPALLAQITAVDRFARSMLPVLIQGETGTGKELFARRAHAMSPRAGQPMLCLNCAAIPENLLESTLFGTTRGAFTGAENKKGLFALAHGGTLFLDELNSMPMALQSKLLRVLQDGTYLPLGAERPLKADVRLVAALNQNPLEAIRDGRLREDLYYRLNVGVITIPALRERPSDIALLARRFVARDACELNSAITGIADAALAQLMQHDWPGNVRELENVIRRSLLLSQDSGLLSSINFCTGPLEVPRAGPSALADGRSLKQQLAQVEARLISEVLERLNGNVAAAARELGIPRTTLMVRMKKLKLVSPAASA